MNCVPPSSFCSIFTFFKCFFTNFHLSLIFDRDARAKKPYNTLQKVSTPLEVPNYRIHVRRNIAYFAESPLLWALNVPKMTNVDFSSLLVLSFTICMQKVIILRPYLEK